MNKQEILTRITNLQGKASSIGRGSGLHAAAKELIKRTVGKNNSFYEELDHLTSSSKGYTDHFIFDLVSSNVRAFKDAIESDLVSNVSIQRQAQIDVVSDFLGQSHELLHTKGIHPAAAAILVGASLEEFLRNWCEEEGKEILKNDGIDSYSKFLKDKDLLDKQDFKDITSWAGIRNDAAHGHWDKVNDDKKISIMLEGVNHFLRSKTKT